jgi:hypothetical protein
MKNILFVILLLGISDVGFAQTSPSGQQPPPQTGGQDSTRGQSNKPPSDQKINPNPYDPNSVNNPFGQQGNPYNPDSIKNKYAPYGSPSNPYSPNNPYGGNPAPSPKGR